MTSSKGAPIAASERALALDALRGLALFGVLMVNLLTQFRVSAFEQLVPLSEASRLPVVPSSADRVVALAASFALEGKAVTLFSLLFGIGLAAQRERSQSRGISFGTYVARRLGFLLLLGLAHLFLVWDGDILTLYALVGALAALLMGLPTSALLVGALALFVVQVLPLPYPTPFASSEELLEHVAAARRVYGFGTFGEVLAFRVHEVRHVAAVLVWTAPRTLGLFLLGACAWRAGIFQRAERRRGLVRGVAMVGIGAGAAAAWAGASRVDLGRWNDALYMSAATLLALGYAATVVVAFERPRLARALSRFAPLGRTALTSYLTQSLVLGAIFQGWGLGLFGRLGEARAAAIGVVLFVVQTIASALWLRRHRFGPVEWLWRSFTYAAWQPMRR